jgi:hypothetical protein
MNDIMADADVRRYCMQVADVNGQAVPGIVIPFETTITPGANFFGQALAGGDKTFTQTPLRRRSAPRECLRGLRRHGFTDHDERRAHGIGATRHQIRRRASPIGRRSAPRRMCI